jgi:hypothetical protein
MSSNTPPPGGASAPSPSETATPDLALASQGFSSQGSSVTPASPPPPQQPQGSCPPTAPAAQQQPGSSSGGGTPPDQVIHQAATAGSEVPTAPKKTPLTRQQALHANQDGDSPPVLPAP